MTRSNAREIAVHMVYSMSFTDAPAELMLEERMGQEYYEGLRDVTEIYAERPNKKQMEYIQTLVSGVQEKKQELDSSIEKFSVGWKLSRISKISMAIMETAMYEILYLEDVPTGVAINEAVELCKRYEEEKTASFVNGILSSFAKEVANHVSGT